MKQRSPLYLFILLLVLLISSCGSSSSSSAQKSSEPSAEKSTPAVTEKEQSSVETVPSSEETDFESATAETTADNASTGIKHQLYFDVTLKPALLFSKYDIEIWLDNKEIGTVENGKTFTTLLEADAGTHTVSFYKSGDQSIKASKTIDLKNDSTFSCKLASKSDSIDISKYKFDKNGAGADLVMIDVVGKDLNEAQKLLAEIGFSNVNPKPENDSPILWPFNWVVIEQNIKAGETNDKNIEIVLLCRKKEDSSESTETGTSEESQKDASSSDKPAADADWYENTYNDYASKLESAYNKACEDIQAKIDEGITYEPLADLISEKTNEIGEIGAEGLNLMADHAADYPLTTGEYMNWSTKLTSEATQYGAKIQEVFMAAVYDAMMKDALN